MLSVCSALLKILNNGVFFMKKFGRDRIALFLTCMSVLGSRTSAMNTNKAQNPQSLVAVGGATFRDNQSVKQGLTKNQKIGIGAAITALAAVPVIAFTIWGIKRHSKSEQDQHEKTKNDKKFDNNKIDENENDEKVNNGETDENKNEKLLDSFIEFLDNGVESHLPEDGKNIENKDELIKNADGIIELVSGLCKRIKNNKFGDEDLKEENFSKLKLQYIADRTIELEVLVNENSPDKAGQDLLKITITKIDSGFKLELKKSSDNINNALVLQAKK